jgi:hypothetical protein
MNPQENAEALEKFFIKWAKSNLSFNELRSVDKSNYIGLAAYCGPKKGGYDKNYYIYDRSIPIAGIFESLEAATQCLDEFLIAVNHPEWTTEGLKAAIAELKLKKFDS